MGKSSSIVGCVITNGTIGIFSSAAGNVINKCRIINNWQTGIIVVRHLPRIEDNIIAFNRASGIQGWDVRSTVASINHNTIAFNANHGIAMGGASRIIIENNTIAFNERFGLKLSEDAQKSEISKNNIYKNLPGTKFTPEGNFSFDPAFIAPRSGLNFRPDPKLCCKIKGTDGKDLGFRQE
jgi:parallel beta-helix repeat protein